MGTFAGSLRQNSGRLFWLRRGTGPTEDRQTHRGKGKAELGAGWCGEMAQWLGVRAPAEALGPSASSHRAAHNHLKFQFQGIWCLPLASQGTGHTCGKTFIQAKCSPIFKWQKKEKPGILIQRAPGYCFQHAPPNQVFSLREAWVLVSTQPTPQFNKQKGIPLPVESNMQLNLLSINAILGGPTS